MLTQMQPNMWQRAASGCLAQLSRTQVAEAQDTAQDTLRQIHQGQVRTASHAGHSVLPAPAAQLLAACCVM